MKKFYTGVELVDGSFLFYFDEFSINLNSYMGFFIVQLEEEYEKLKKYVEGRYRVMQ